MVYIDSPHKTAEVPLTLEGRGIERTTCLNYSPDIKIIEHACDALCRHIVHIFWNLAGIENDPLKRMGPNTPSSLNQFSGKQAHMLQNMHQCRRMSYYIFTD